MKLYVYAAEPDEIPYFDAFSEKYGIEYDYTEEAVSDRVYHVFQLLKDFAEGQENPLEVK
ncbi:MAG: hypothetical protein IKE36_10410 [Solobacterium sp.]|nr:hypothetical protein [Solobacterium sp.]